MNHAIYWRSSIGKIMKSCSIHNNKEAMTALIDFKPADPYRADQGRVSWPQSATGCWRVMVVHKTMDFRNSLGRPDIYMCEECHEVQEKPFQNHF